MYKKIGGDRLYYLEKDNYFEDYKHETLKEIFIFSIFFTSTCDTEDNELVRHENGACKECEANS